MTARVEPQASGSFKVRFRLNRKATSETFATKKEATRFTGWLDALGPQGALDKLYSGGEQVADVPPLNDVAAAHIAHLTGIEDGTRLTYTRLWARVWAPRLGYLPANAVTRDAVALAVNDLAASYSTKSLENQRGLLSGVLKRAVREGYLRENPAAGIRLPRGDEGEAVEMRIVTPDEYVDLAERIHPHYRTLVDFLAGTGARWGEAVALTVGDVQLPNVRIRRALKWNPSGPRKVGSAKTKRSNRTVMLPPELIEPMRDACAGKKATDLVFTAPRGGRVLHRTFWSRVWLPAVAQMDPRPRIHDLRHSHASTLLAAGVPIYVVQARLGHESIKTTVDTYGHLLPDAQRLAADAASYAFKGRKAPLELEEGAAG